MVVGFITLIIPNYWVSRLLKLPRFSTRFYFIDRLYLTADTIYKTINGGSNTRFFDFNDKVKITSISLKYYNMSDAQLTTPVANPSEITKVKIIATVKGKNDNDPEVTLTTSVKPRNLFDL